MVGVETQSYYIGEAAQHKRGLLNISHPIEQGLITNWDDMEKIWEICFTKELQVDPMEHKVMLTESPGNPKPNREKMTEMMFETFQVQALYVAIQAVLSLISNGRSNGVVCDSGDGVTSTVPVFEGFAVQYAIRKNFVSGRAITDHLIDLLIEDGVSIEADNYTWK